jgi:hypothetical protein
MSVNLVTPTAAAEHELLLNSLHFAVFLVECIKVQKETSAHDTHPG